MNCGFVAMLKIGDVFHWKTVDDSRVREHLQVFCLPDLLTLFERIQRFYTYLEIGGNNVVAI